MVSHLVALLYRDFGAVVVTEPDKVSIEYTPDVEDIHFTVRPAQMEFTVTGPMLEYTTRKK